MFKRPLTALLLGLALLSSPAWAEDQLAETLKTSHCAPFANQFMGGQPAKIIRVLPLHNPGLPDDRFSVVMATPNGIPVIDASGGFWAFSPATELNDANARAAYEIFARYGAWLVIKTFNGTVDPTTQLTADIFIHAPSDPHYPHNPKCYRMNPFVILGQNLPPLDYAAQ